MAAINEQRQSNNEQRQSERQDRQSDKLQEVIEQLMRLNAKYDGIGEQLEHVRNRIEEQAINIEGKLTKLNNVISGTDGTGGLIVRVDRLEQAEVRLNKRYDLQQEHSARKNIGVYLACIGAVVAGFASMVFQWLRSK